MSIIAFTIPGQPVAKGRPRACIRGGKVATYTPDNTARYENLVKLAAQEAMKGLPPIGGQGVSGGTSLVAEEKAG